jgi:hypothetical protein
VTANCDSLEAPEFWVVQHNALFPNELFEPLGIRTRIAAFNPRCEDARKVITLFIALS